MLCLLLGVDTVTANHYVWQDQSYKHIHVQTFERGQVVEFSNDLFCHSFVLPPAFSHKPSALLGVIYVLMIVYLFLGVSIVSDIFMNAIESITSTQRTIWVKDSMGH